MEAEALQENILSKFITYKRKDKVIKEKKKKKQDWKDFQSQM